MLKKGTYVAIKDDARQIFQVEKDGDEYGLVLGRIEHINWMIRQGYEFWAIDLDEAVILAGRKVAIDQRKSTDTNA